MAKASFQTQSHITEQYAHLPVQIQNAVDAFLSVPGKTENVSYLFNFPSFKPIKEWIVE